MKYISDNPGFNELVKNGEPVTILQAAGGIVYYDNNESMWAMPYTASCGDLLRHAVVDSSCDSYFREDEINFVAENILMGRDVDEQALFNLRGYDDFYHIGRDDDIWLSMADKLWALGCSSQVFVKALREAYRRAPDVIDGLRMTFHLGLGWTFKEESDVNRASLNYVRRN